MTKQKKTKDVQRPLRTLDIQMKMISAKEIKEKNIPDRPGSYQYYNEPGEVIYVGKAANLRARVFSYWRESADLSSAKQAMMKEIDKVEWIETETEIEALLLEANLIKKYQPPYNVLMRDDKRYSYIKVATEEEWPRVFFTRQIDQAGRYFGPYTSTDAAREVLKIIRRLWPYRSCRTMPKKSCLYYRIGKCVGACEARISNSEYQKIIKNICLFLEGKKKTIIRQNEKELAIYQKKIAEEPDNAVADEWRIKIFERERWLKSVNHILSSARILSIGEKYANDVIELAKVFGLPRPPERIEGYDVSELFGRGAVGSMVVFQGGEPNKSEYRKFKLIANQTIGRTAGDTDRLKEMLDRRFKRVNDSEAKDKWPLPDLIVLDGGKGQLNTALMILRRYKLDIPILAISKGEGLRSALAPDKIFFPNEKKPLELPLASPALHLVKRVRDEAHRFAVSYHKILRKKRFWGKQ